MAAPPTGDLYLDGLRLRADGVPTEGDTIQRIPLRLGLLAELHPHAGFRLRPQQQAEVARRG